VEKRIAISAGPKKIAIWPQKGSPVVKPSPTDPHIVEGSEEDCRKVGA